MSKNSEILTPNTLKQAAGAELVLSFFADAAASASKKLPELAERLIALAQDAHVDQSVGDSRRAFSLLAVAAAEQCLKVLPSEKRAEGDRALLAG
eukprot:307298-Prorocentrum_minimum.AAC.2